MPYKLFVEDIIETKKNHPCGSNKFKIVRTGMDFVIECSSCGKSIWISRVKLEKRITKLYRNGNEVDKSLWEN